MIADQRPMASMSRDDIQLALCSLAPAPGDLLTDAESPDIERLGLYVTVNGDIAPGSDQLDIFTDATFIHLVEAGMRMGDRSRLTFLGYLAQLTERLENNPAERLRRAILLFLSRDEVIFHLLRWLMSTTGLDAPMPRALLRDLIEQTARDPHTTELLSPSQITFFVDSDQDSIAIMLLAGLVLTADLRAALCSRKSQVSETLSSRHAELKFHAGHPDLDHLLTPAGLAQLRKEFGTMKSLPSSAAADLLAARR